MQEAKSARVAVIGAGPAGLVVARELIKEGHDVTVFEASSAIGGAWCFDNSTDSDLLGLKCDRRKVHSSMYNGLRANLPRHMMTYLDFPFLPAAMGGRSHDPRAYPLHTEILAYLEAFADKFHLREHLQLNTRVLKIDPIIEPRSLIPGVQCNGGSGSSITPRLAHANGWRIVTQKANSTDQHEVLKQKQRIPQQEWMFDAVASCVGMFSEPNLPEVPGMSDWPGLQVHSHNYRDPKMFAGMNVLVVGASFSGEEMARHIAREAKHVYHSARTFTGPGTAREPAPAAQDPRASLQQQQQQQQADGLDPWPDPIAAVAPNCQQAVANPDGCTQLQQPPQLQQQLDGIQSPVHQKPPQQQVQIPEAKEPRPNITRVLMLQQLLRDGSAVLQGGRVLEGLDAVVYCTGYKHSYPWLGHLQIVESDDMHVRPLWLHMFPPSYAPSLSFIGLPWRCAKMPQFQLQGQLLARLLSGRAQLPPLLEMQQAQQQLFAAMAAAGIPRRYTHCMASFMPQDEWQYAQQLADLAAQAAATSTHKPLESCQGQCSRCMQCHSKDCQSQAPGILGLSTCCGCKQQPPHQHQQQQHVVDCDSQGLQQQPAFDELAAAHNEQDSQGRQLLTMPDQLMKLGKSLGVSILGRPDTFRTCGALNPQQRQLLAMPEYMIRLGKSQSGSILGRPDTFRDIMSPEVQVLLREAEQQMLGQLPE